MRCLCGLSLWVTERTCHPRAWARHVRHMEDFARGRPWPLGELAMSP